jgi:SPP1 gp7 family putative phage head morphogenesis protein
MVRYSQHARFLRLGVPHVQGRGGGEEMNSRASHLAALAVLKNAHLRTLPRLPRQQHPTLIALRYFKRLRAFLADVREQLESKLVPALPRLAEAGKAARGVEAEHKDAEGDDPDSDVGAILDEIADNLADKWTRDRFAAMVQPIAGDVEKFHAGQLNKTLAPVIGVDVVGGEPWIRDTLEAFTKENVALIKKLPATLFSDLESMLTRQIADGARWEDMASTIRDRYDVTERHANLIARDQAGKLYGDLNRVRQNDLGITGYIWRTMNDNRVREEHEEREGVEFQWNGPPEDGNPGEPVLCRCFAEPDLRPVIAAAKGEDL